MWCWSKNSLLIELNPLGCSNRTIMLIDKFNQQPIWMNQCLNDRENKETDIWLIYLYSKMQHIEHVTQELCNV